MDKKLRLAVLFPNCPNFGLIKDVGQIPYVLGKNYSDMETVLVSDQIDYSGEHIKDVAGLRIEKASGFFCKSTLSGLWYILKNAHKVDWFVFYFGGRQAYLWTKLYKLLNPAGKVYIKLDMDYAACRKCLSSSKYKAEFNRAAYTADIVSAESKKIGTLIEEFCSRKIEIISNGYIEHAKSTLLRQNTFITVGRLGTYEKATDILLEAFSETAHLHDWNLRLVGSVDPAFEEYKACFFQKHPELSERIIFTGPVYDKQKLYDEYASARVFLLPSRHEAFPLVGPEALYCGCRMILSDAVPPFDELTNNGQYGTSVKPDDVTSLANAMLAETKRAASEEEPAQISEYAEKNLSWDAICSKLYNLMHQQ